MAQSVAISGFNFAMDIVDKFRPRYWENGNYGDLQYLIKEVYVDSCEFAVLEAEIEDAQDKNDVKSNKEITEIHRIQNPYSYAGFLLAKRQMIMKYGYVYQVRKYKLIDKKFLSIALKYNCDDRRFGDPTNYGIFQPGLPKILDNRVLLLLQVLTIDDEHYHQDVTCIRDSEFYIDYVIYFD